ncbi:hypothetical protein HaLaN_13895 [Haematococcus lacustris]|uniref:Uncharacterized protein n=1 Tax=Haematococcus lacustris TaxID=44745 RepID=A0A699Z5C5_HAELA|nr:hypothetical protein HaLaN_13895 [Haematococcus lacustris]
MVLRSLYFDTGDPYLSILECKALLLALPAARRQQLCGQLDPHKVAQVLEAEHEEGDSLPGSGDEDSYDSSFIDDSSDGSSSEGGSGEEAGAQEEGKGEEEEEGEEGEEEGEEGEEEEEEGEEEEEQMEEDGA